MISHIGVCVSRVDPLKFIYPSAADYMKSGSMFLEILRNGPLNLLRCRKDGRQEGLDRRLLLSKVLSHIAHGNFREPGAAASGILGALQLPLLVRSVTGCGCDVSLEWECSPEL